MAALTHVSMWSEHHGWKRIAALEAARLHPGGTVSARSGLFKCDLCGQYVILTNGDKKTRYFEHSAYETSKDCPDRTFGSSRLFEYQAQEYELPLRLVSVEADRFSLELGLLYVPREQLRRQKLQQVSIQPRGDVSQSFVYSFERLNPDSITYLPVGEIPASEYLIEAGDELSKIWPRHIEGIDPKGSVFDARTGKKLPRNADVRLKKNYYLVTTRLFSNNIFGVEVMRLCKRKIAWNTWYVFQITATGFTEDAARFFLDLHCNLTEFPAVIQPIWPLCIQSPYVIKHHQDNLFLYVRGTSNIVTKLFPDARCNKFPCPLESSALLFINCSDRQQLVSAGRANVLQYTYLWRESLDKISATPLVEICDIKGGKQEGGLQNRLPMQCLLLIRPAFEGTVIMKARGAIIEKRHLAADEKSELDNIWFGCEITILQGLDIVWKVRYERKKHFRGTDDLEILSRLVQFSGKEVAVSHTLGAAAEWLHDYSQVKSWLYQKIRIGRMPEDALRYFKLFIAKQKSKN